MWPAHLREGRRPQSGPGRRLLRLHASCTSIFAHSATRADEFLTEKSERTGAAEDRTEAWRRWSEEVSGSARPRGRPRAGGRRHCRPGLSGRGARRPRTRNRMGSPCRGSHRRHLGRSRHRSRPTGRRAAPDLAASLYGASPSRQGGAILRRILPPDSGPLPTPSVLSVLRPWNLPSPALIARVARRPLAFRPEVAVSTLIPKGQVDISERARGLDDFIGERWPEGLRICAVRRNTGARVVFGRPGAPAARLAEAVLASCAIPATSAR